MIRAGWTMRCAAMLQLELNVIAAEQRVIAFDGGLGIAALASASSLPPGPRRDLEVALWADRIAARGDCMAVIVRPDMTDEEFNAWVDLQNAVHERIVGAA